MNGQDIRIHNVFTGRVRLLSTKGKTCYVIHRQVTHCRNIVDKELKYGPQDHETINIYMYSVFVCMRGREEREERERERERERELHIHVHTCRWVETDGV